MFLLLLACDSIPTLAPDPTSATSTGSTPCPVTRWYRDGDGDGYGDAAVRLYACAAPGGYVANATDCDDEAAEARPGGVEVCNDGLDNDCDGTDGGCRLSGTLDLAHADASWTAKEPLGFCGAAIAGGDLDGDGLDDVVVGCPGEARAGVRGLTSRWTAGSWTNLPLERAAPPPPCTASTP
jgi:hypothetical protein